MSFSTLKCYINILIQPNRSMQPAQVHLEFLISYCGLRSFNYHIEQRTWWGHSILNTDLLDTEYYLGHRAISLLNHCLHLLSCDIMSPLSRQLQTVDQNRTKLFDFMNGVGIANTPKELVNILNKQTGSSIWASTPGTVKTNNNHPDVIFYHVRILQVNVLQPEEKQKRSVSFRILHQILDLLTDNNQKETKIADTTPTVVLS